MKRFIAFIFAVLPLLAIAETYLDIGPLDTLADIKEKFPSAQVKKVSPAWAQPTDALYQIMGTGLSGIIIIKFYDGRPNYKKQLERATDDTVNEFTQILANQTDDEALSVSWVRWVPDSQIPIQRLISKYGKPEKSAFSEESFQPYREWKKKGVMAYLTDDEKNVIRIDFSFTKDEMRKAYLAKYKFIPDDLKESSPSNKKK